jgi:hypothetical protein
MLDHPLSPGELFDREDLSKPENRANQWLLACCCSSDAFRRGLLKLIGLPQDCVLRPVQLDGCRPDLTAFEGKSPVAIVECEAGGRDKPQGDRFARQTKLPLHWIVGVRSAPEDVTWDEVSQLARSPSLDIGPQTHVAFRLLLGAIADIQALRSQKASWLRIPEDLPSVFSSPLFQPLLGLAPLNMIAAWRYAEGSASLRLVAPVSALRTGRNGLGLSAIQVARPHLLLLPAAEHLRDHLDEALGDWVDDWEKVMRRLAPQDAAAGRQGRVDVQLLDGHGQELAEVWSRLAQRLRDWNAPLSGSILNPPG